MGEPLSGARFVVRIGGKELAVARVTAPTLAADPGSVTARPVPRQVGRVIWTGKPDRGAVVLARAVDGDRTLYEWRRAALSDDQRVHDTATRDVGDPARRPYAGFAFLVSMGGDPGGPAAGFLRVTGLERRVEMLEYRAGNDRSLAPRLMPGLALPVTVTFEGGVIGSLDLHTWIQTALDGQAERRDLAVDLLAEDLSTVVQSWRLRRALPKALTGPTLDAMANAVAVEALTVVAESLTVA